VTAPERPKLISSAALFDALVAAGVVREGERIRRVVIDALVGESVVIHVERLGDTRLLSVVRTLEGVEVHEEQPVS